jgi:hypothetical protein
VSDKIHAPPALPPKKKPSVAIVGGWVGPRADLDAVMKRKIPKPYEFCMKYYLQLKNYKTKQRHLLKPYTFFYERQIFGSSKAQPPKY